MSTKDKRNNQVKTVMNDNTNKHKTDVEKDNFPKSTEGENIIAILFFMGMGVGLTGFFISETLITWLGLGLMFLPLLIAIIFGRGKKQRQY